MKTVSVVLPCIRVKNLERIYVALQESCKENTFELIIVSPYKIPDSILQQENVVYLHSYLPPTAAAQMAMLLCSGEFIYLPTDDGLVQKNALDVAVKLFRENLDDKGIINMKYHEGALDVNTLEQIIDLKEFPSDYWNPKHHQQMCIPGVKPDWIMALQFFMKTKYFYELGGFDCEFEILNYSLHDLVYRAQQNGSKVITLPIYAILCSHLAGHTGDHRPVHDAAVGPDWQKFFNLYIHPDAAQKRIHLEYDNWKRGPNVWTRRFDFTNLPL